MAIIKFTFDMNGRYEYPIITIANPNFEEFSIIEQTKNLIITPRYNEISEVTFSIYREYNGFVLPYYDRVLKNKLINIDGFGWWIIDTITEYNDGGVPSKDIHAFSYEYTLNYKGISVLDGTYKFYDLFNPENTLLHQLISVSPIWKIGTVDSELLNLYRTFDMPDATLYGFLTNEVANTYEAIFEFDTENLLINARHPSNVVNETDILLSFDNVNKEIYVEELATDIYTVLRVNGADNVSINTVNPLGDNRIYNFSYYKNSEWIGDVNLINKITEWEKLVESYREEYSNLLDSLSFKNKELLILKADLRDLQSELNALEIVRKNLTDQPEEFKKKTDEVDAKNVEIQRKEVEISDKEKEIEDVNKDLKSINNEVSYNNFFTSQERLALDPYIIESVYTDENFIITEEMEITPDADGETLVITTTGTKKIKDLQPTDILIDAQYISNQLLQQGKDVLEKISQPSFTFSLSSTNFLFVEKFLPFIKQLRLGSSINVEIREEVWAYPALLEMVLDYDNPTSFSMTFSNRFRLNDAEWTYAELYNEQSKVSSQVGTTLGVAAEPVLNGTISSMSSYMANSLIAANQEIQSTVDNEVSMGGYGLRCKKKDDAYSTGYDPRQLWLNNNLITMTDDNWQSIKLAIGYISTSQDPSKKYYGVNAEVISGNLLAGNQLIIQDGVAGQESTFIVDADGARLTNASFTLTTLDNKGRIVLNPDDGIRIQTNKSGLWTNAFYVDTVGNLVAADITATGGTIGGFNLSPNSLTSTTKDSKGSIIQFNSDGTGRWGGLYVDDINSWRFEGDIEAEGGTIGGFEITSSSIESSNGRLELNDNGTGRWGLLTINSNSASFDGNIYADNLDSGGFTSSIIGDKFDDNAFTSSNVGDKFATNSFGRNNVESLFTSGSINGDKIVARSITADLIQAGTITANEVKAGTFVANGGRFTGYVAIGDGESLTEGGALSLNGRGQIALVSYGDMVISTDDLDIEASGTINFDGSSLILFNDTTRFNRPIQVGTDEGQTDEIEIDTSGTDIITLRFRNGIFIGGG